VPAQIILLLISSDFLASKYCYDIEMKRAMERHDSGEARVIPIILRHVLWKSSPFSKLQALPTNLEPVKDGNWRSIDEAFKDIAESLEKVIKSINSKNVGPDPDSMPSNNGPKTIIVDQMHHGDFTTITDAIVAAAPGARILVRSGVYDEGLIVDKPLEIVGDGHLGDVVIRAVGCDVILFKAIKGKISNFMLRQNGGGNWHGVDVAQGCLELVSCDISSDSLSCVAVNNNAYPKIVDNKIHDGKSSGIHVYENGQGVIKDNDIYRNVFAGIWITGDGNPTLRNNKIHDGKYIGLRVDGNGRGIIENNDIFGNEMAGVSISEGGNPTLRNNKIYDGKGVGIRVFGHGHGVIEDNDIYGNASGGVDIVDDSNPMIRFNRIYKNGYWAIWVSGKSSGTIEDNDLRGNSSGAMVLSEDSKQLIKLARNLEK